MNILLVAFGAFFGAISRYTLGKIGNSKGKPYGTWAANISGSILLGVLAVLLDHNAIKESIWLIVGTGFCGAYTTFSTFGTETLSMLLEGKWDKAVAYVISSLLVSLCSVGIIFLLFG